MTIVCIAADLIPGKLGGAEVHAVEVIKRLGLSHRILLFVGRDTSIKKILPKNVTVFPVAYPQIPNFFGFSYIFFGTPQIIRALKTQKIDLIWAKQSFPQAQVGVFLKLVFQKPLYITAQNPMLHFEELVAKGPIRIFQSIFAHFITPWIIFAYKKADLVAAVSRYSRDLAQKMGAKNTSIIPNGVDIAPFAAIKHLPTKTFTLVTTSSLIPRNGIDILIKAVALLPKKINWQLLIAGDGPEETLLRQLAQNLPVTFLGRVGNTDIPGLLAKADVFIRPSRKEGFGVSFIEAMAAGIPVIATPVGGIPDFAFHNQTALLAKPENPQSLAKEIQKLYADKKLRQTLVRNAKKLVNDKYQWDTVAKQVEQAMQTL